MYGPDISYGISKVSFEIAHKYLTHTLEDVCFIQSWTYTFGKL